MQPRAAHRSREHSYLVASRGECCDNDNRFVATYQLHALGGICLYGSVSGSRRAARCSRARSCLVAIRDGRCDNDDAKSESITFSHIGILCGIYDMGSVLAAVVSLVVREGAVCLVALRDGRCDNDDATFDSFRSYILGDV